MFRTICLGPGSSSPRMHANGGGRLTQPTRAPRHKIQKTRRKTMTGRRKPQMRTLHFSYSLGNGHPVQCSCLENPRDGGAWWAAVSGVAKSWTQLKWLSSSSSSSSSVKVKVKLLSHVRLLATPWTVAYQLPLSMEFSRQEHWSRLPFPLQGNLPDLGIEPRSPALQADTLPSEPQGKHYVVFKNAHLNQFTFKILGIWLDSAVKTPNCFNTCITMFNSFKKQSEVGD